MANTIDADTIDNVLLEHMKRIQATLLRVERTQEDHTQRLGRIEMTLAEDKVIWAEQSVRIDRLNERLTRIERRLELA